eukprot:TRINITY_DN18468_c0_g1_i1.p1 TRINITY_DN18468_c0_g1~~TRINITY_DN18468_c0_g1_i1.p1  ORF type:complete len:310 (+),score=85.59 TRINITY_DN18468_c0_g1_i1:59-931(+)
MLSSTPARSLSAPLPQRRPPPTPAPAAAAGPGDGGRSAPSVQRTPASCGLPVWRTVSVLSSGTCFTQAELNDRRCCVQTKRRVQAARSGCGAEVSLGWEAATPPRARVGRRHAEAADGSSEVRCRDSVRFAAGQTRGRRRLHVSAPAPEATQRRAKRATALPLESLHHNCRSSAALTSPSRVAGRRHAAHRPSQWTVHTREYVPPTTIAQRPATTPAARRPPPRPSKRMEPQLRESSAMNYSLSRGASRPPPAPPADDVRFQHRRRVATPAGGDSAAALMTSRPLSLPSS